MRTHIYAHEATKNKNCKRSRGSLLLHLNLLKSKTKCTQMYKKKYDEQQFISYKSCRKRFKQSYRENQTKLQLPCDYINSNDPRKIWKIIHDLAQCFSTCGTRTTSGMRTVFKGCTSHFHYFYKCNSLDYQLPSIFFIRFCF